jgi:hypothetical protein
VHAILLLAILATPLHGQQSNPGPQGEEVVVQARKLLIPHVPASVDQAHAEYGKIGPMISNGLQDLELELVKLYASAPKNDPMPASIRVRSSEVEVAKFFSRMIKDDRYAQLQLAVIKAWNEWQFVLLETELASVRSPVHPENAQAPDAYLETKKRLENEKFRLRERMEIEKTMIDALTRTNGTQPDAVGYKYKLDMSSQFETKLSTSKQLTVVANEKAPQLAQAWTPFVEYLNACAVKLADLDSPTTPYHGNDLPRLQFQAKIAFLERCRSALWFCQTIWARMTTSTAPPPLKELHSVSALSPG